MKAWVCKHCGSKDMCFSRVVSEDRYGGYYCGQCGRFEDEPEQVPEKCPECDGHGQDKWGESCNECHGEGVIYVDP